MPCTKSCMEKNNPSLYLLHVLYLGGGTEKPSDLKFQKNNTNKVCFILIVICFFLLPIFLSVLLGIIYFHADKTPTATTSIFSRLPGQIPVKIRLVISKSKSRRNRFFTFRRKFLRPFSCIPRHYPMKLCF